jgi:hypothetical protein
VAVVAHNDIVNASINRAFEDNPSMNKPSRHESSNLHNETHNLWASCLSKHTLQYRRNSLPDSVLVKSKVYSKSCNCVIGSPCSRCDAHMMTFVSFHWMGLYTQFVHFGHSIFMDKYPICGIHNDITFVQGVLR